MPITEKQLAANRANAAKSAGPHSPEGKARSAQNARSHGFTASTFAVVRLEDLQEIAHLKADLTAVYQPVNSQELFAIERMALAQQAMLRAARLESGLFTNCLDIALNDNGTPFAPMSRELAGDGDIEITRAQNRNYALADGFQRMTRHPNNTWSLFLRYQAQSERHYRRAVEEFDRLKALRAELQNEPIWEVQPEENEPDCTPPHEPISTLQPNPELPPILSPQKSAYSRIYNTRMRMIVVPILCSAFVTGGWGPRGHQSANHAAVKSIPADGPVFLQEFEDWIAKTGPIPDSWRLPSEPYSKIFEDPNHGWFKEQFAFMSDIPRSRYEFVLRLYDEYLRIKDKDPARAALTNVRWTGTLPYAAMENYDRMKSSMRLYRAALTGSSAQAKQDARYLAQDIAFYLGWLGHYTADGAMPLHDSINHDGWLGENPKGFTTDPGIHARFESSFVELIKLTGADLLPLVSKAKRVDDPFAAIIHHLDDAGSHVQEVYELDKRGAFSDAKDAQTAQLVKMQLAKAAALLRDLAYTAWIDSVESVAPVNPARNPLSPSNPKFNRATGSAPPEGPAVPYRPN